MFLFRTDSLYIPGTTLRISQCLGLACFVVGLTLLVVFTFIRPCKRETEQTAVCAEAVAVSGETDEVQEPEVETEEEQILNHDENTESEDPEDGKID